jgi:hypothetical protein
MTVFTPARVLIEFSADHYASVLGLDAEGFVKRQVFLGNVKTPHDLSHLVRQHGWNCDEWNDEGWFPGITTGAFLCEATPLPIRVVFVGSEILEAEAVRLAHQAGLPATGVVSQEVVPDEGKNYVTLTVETPPKWNWDTEAPQL